jgi:hypothetical protein
MSGVPGLPYVYLLDVVAFCKWKEMTALYYCWGTCAVTRHYDSAFRPLLSFLSCAVASR